MFDKIVLKYFQSHKKTVLRLHPGINGIIGRPNSGKTAIIRAILLLKNNRPTGFAYHNNLTKNPKTEVHVKPSNSPLLKLIRTKSKALFYYGKKSFKTGRYVPDEITNALNLEDINFGLQLGLPFLILSPPSEIAREINKVTESEVINKCIKITNEKLNKLKSKRKSLQSSIDETQKKLIPYKRLYKVKPILERAIKYDKQILKREEKIEELLGISNFINKAQKAINNQEKPLQAKGLIEQAESLQYDMENLASQMTLLENIKMLKQSLQHAVEEKHELIDNYTDELKKSKRCPTCFQPIKNNTIEDIWKELNR